MTVKRLENGQLAYTYTTPKSNKRVIPVKNMMHIRGFGMDGVCGMIPIQIGRDVIGTALSTDEAAGKVFENGLQTSGLLTSKNALKADQR